MHPEKVASSDCNKGMNHEIKTVPNQDSPPSFAVTAGVGALRTQLQRCRSALMRNTQAILGAHIATGAPDAHKNQSPPNWIGSYMWCYGLLFWREAPACWLLMLSGTAHGLDQAVALFFLY